MLINKKTKQGSLDAVHPQRLAFSLWSAHLDQPCGTFEPSKLIWAIEFPLPRVSAIKTSSASTQ
jgi:hypothetical protein